MKKNLAILPFMVSVILVSLSSNAQEVITGGNMENEADWTAVWRTDAPDAGTITFNYTDSLPAQGDGGCLRVTGFGQGGAYVFQEVTLIPRHTYSLDAAFKNISTDAINNTWIEIILSKTAPVETADYGPGAGDYRAMMNTWFAADTLNYDGLVSDRFEFKFNDADLVEFTGFTLVPTESETTWYIVIKIGCWNTAGEAVPTYDFLFDNISLTDLGADNSFEINNLIVGEVTDEVDYKCDLTMTWDADSVYMAFVVADELIHTSESDVWINDNIEVYFDMDNSKAPTWPRNAGWPASSYDANDYQLRMVPGIDWSVNNSLEGVRQVYEVTAGGYNFTLNIDWDSLLVGFSAAAGTQIGFDVLGSDNDGDGRNQITWNAPTEMPWNDVSLFGTVELLEEGGFLVILDEEPPTVPGNPAADEEGTTITWDASTDNIAVYTYRVYDGSAVVDTLYANEADNSYTFAELEEGAHTLGVLAVDNSGNKSTKATVEVEIEGPDALDDHGVQPFAVFPNPTDGIATITSVTNSTALLEVYSITGELIGTHSFASDYRLDMSMMGAGMYILKIESEGLVQVNRLIVK